MALVRLTAPVATTPTTFVQPSVDFITNLVINARLPSRILGTNIVAGAIFNVAGVTYVADSATAITGTQGPLVKITASGESASAAFTTTIGAGFAYNEAYKSFLDTAGALYVFVDGENRFYPAFAEAVDYWGTICTDKLNWWIAEDKTARSDNHDEYTKVSTIIAKYSGKIWTRFDIRTNSVGSAANGRIYVNDVAVGTERTNSTTTYTFYTEEIEVVAGDEIQLYTKSDARVLSSYFGAAGYLGREYIEAIS